MPTHLGFLRAVNIGKRQFRTTDLRSVLTGAGYGDVATYIQTGNIRITSPIRSRAKIETELETLFLADRGFTVSTIVLSPAELRQVTADADELATSVGFEYGQYVSLLKDEPNAAATEAIEARSGNGETFVVRGRALHLLYDIPFNEARTTTAQIERAIGVATNRNAKVLRELVALWC
ncbi:MAG: hypothetical protein JWP74_2939 [Marmoricola sp.]|nr:hypothetical protein [Marmoricola sp.]